MRKQALYFPKSILIETSNLCQGLCKFCPYSLIRKKEQLELLNESRFYSLIDEISNYDVKRITLFNNNEPLLDKRIYKFINYVYENVKNVEITLSTNGICLTKKIIDLLYKSHLTTLYVSIPTIDVEKYKYLMNVDPTNLFNLLENIDDRKLNKMIRIAVPETKYFNKDEMKAKFMNFMICSWPLEYKSNWGLDNIINNLSKSLNYVGPCDRPLDQAVISCNGDVIICCRDWKKENVIGNIYDSSLFEIWHSKKMTSIQEKIIKQQYDDVECCKTCNLNCNNKGGRL